MSAPSAQSTDSSLQQSPAETPKVKKIPIHLQVSFFNCQITQTKLRPIIQE